MLTMIQTVDAGPVQELKNLVSTYKMEDHSLKYIIEEGILLFPDSTARTNIMLRDEKGRFMSYRDAPTKIKNAVESLIPFPVVG